MASVQTYSRVYHDVTPEQATARIREALDLASAKALYFTAAFDALKECDGKVFNKRVKDAISAMILARCGRSVTVSHDDWPCNRVRLQFNEWTTHRNINHYGFSVSLRAGRVDYSATIEDEKSHDRNVQANVDLYREMLADVGGRLEEYNAARRAVEAAQKLLEGTFVSVINQQR